MCFYSRQSQIRCLAYIVSLICIDVLKDLKSGSTKEVNKALNSQEAQYKSNSYDILYNGGRSAIVKVGLLNLQILRSLS